MFKLKFFSNTSNSIFTNGNIQQATLKKEFNVSCTICLAQ